MWTNFAPGNISVSRPTRAVCGGDFSTSGLSARTVSVCRNRIRPAFHQAKLLRRHALHIQKRIADRLIRKRHPFVASDPTPRLQSAANSSFLRVVPAGRHVVHRPPVGKQEFEIPRDNPRRHQRLLRRHAFVRRRKRKPLILHHQFMQQRGAGAPMADDEDRRLDFCRRDPAGRKSPAGLKRRSELPSEMGVTPATTCKAVGLTANR